MCPKKKAEAAWRRWTIVCPECKQRIVMCKLYFSAAGNIKIEGFCTNCLRIISWEKCLMEIIAEHKEEKNKGAADQQTDGGKKEWTM